MAVRDDLVLMRWSFRAEADDAALVIPDGCRDIVLSQRPGQRPFLFATGLDATARVAQVGAGQVLTGLRLRPGAQVREATLGSLGDEEALQLIHEGSRLDQVVHVDPRLEEALFALGEPNAPVGAASGRLGVSARTLQRFVCGATGRAPIWWSRLARARRAAARLSASEATCGIAEVAHCHGYADQPHLTREMRAWFGATPTMLRTDTPLAAQLSEPGYATALIF